MDKERHSDGDRSSISYMHLQYKVYNELQVLPRRMPGMKDYDCH